MMPATGRYMCVAEGWRVAGGGPGAEEGKGDYSGGSGSENTGVFSGCRYLIVAGALFY